MRHRAEQGIVCCNILHGRENEDQERIERRFAEAFLAHAFVKRRVANRIHRLKCIAVLYNPKQMEASLMAKPRSQNRSGKAKLSRSLVVRLDEESKTFLTKAGVRSAAEQIVALTPEAQLAFWTALNETPRLTAAQKRLGSMMRGQS
jgi:hypothetical protein